MLPDTETLSGQAPSANPSASAKLARAGRPLRPELLGSVATGLPPTIERQAPLSNLFATRVKPTAKSAFTWFRDTLTRLNKARAERVAIAKVLAPRASAPTLKTLSDRVEHVERMTTILLSIHSLGVLLLTYRGVSVPMTENGGGLLQKGEALALASTIAVLSWLGWFYLFSLVARLHGRRLLCAVAGAILYVSALTAIDAQFVMLGIGGSAATKISLEEVGKSYEERRPVYSARIAFMHQLLPALRAQEARFAKSEVDERAGKETGVGGQGRVSAGYGKIAAQLGGLNRFIEEGLARAAVIEREISDGIARINKLVHLQTPIAQRAEKVASEAALLDEKLAQLAQLDFAPAILATLNALESSFPVPTAAANKFEERQNAELALIAKSLAPMTQALRGALQELSLKTVEPPPRKRPIDPLTATKVYWRELLPLWVASGFVDVAPALLLFMLLAGQREAEKTEAPRGRGRP